jgi:hypothetical protein
MRKCMFSTTYLHEAVNLRPGDLPIEEITPQEMRKALARAIYSSPLLRHVQNMAEHEGWTGEDKFTALAFYAVLRMEEREFYDTRRAELEPAPPFFVTNVKPGGA